MFSMVESVKTLFLSHLPKNWECSGNVLMNIHCIENRWRMFSMARNFSRRMYRLIKPIIFGVDIFSFMPLKTCASYSWQENVTLKIDINSSRVATPPLKSCKVLSSEKALPFAKKCKYLSKSSNHFWFTPILKLILSKLKKMSRKENCKKVLPRIQEIPRL